MMRLARIGWLVVAVSIIAAPSAFGQAPADIQKAVDAAYAKYKDLKEGKNADYIPALAKVDPNLFGIAVITAMLAEVTGVAGSVAHNLMLALVFALSASGAYGILYNLLADLKLGLSPPARYLLLASLFPLAEVAYGVLALVISPPLPRCCAKAASNSRPAR